MTTFKNNAKYAELLFGYLDLAVKDDIPLSVPEVLSVFRWRFKGGSMEEAGCSGAIPVKTSGDVFPDCTTEQLVKRWPDGRDCQALFAVLRNRALSGKSRPRAVLARLSTFQLLVSDYGANLSRVQIYSGMTSVYHLFGLLWEWCPTVKPDSGWDLLGGLSRELLVGCASVAMVHLPTVDSCRQDYSSILRESRLAGLLLAIRQVKMLLGVACGRKAMGLARVDGVRERERWGGKVIPGVKGQVALTDQGTQTRYIGVDLGPFRLRVSQHTALLGAGEVRYAMGKSDMERLHQLLMSTASALVGVCAQAVVGTARQKSMARLAVEVTERNVSRVVESSRRVSMGDEVLVCKGYRRAYTALLGVLAGPLCAEETKQLTLEASGTAASGVLDVEGFLVDARGLDAASALNASKVFKICPAPDVSPGAAMIDRVKTIAGGNSVDPEMMVRFRDELRSQILRAYIRKPHTRLKLRAEMVAPIWHHDYLNRDFDKVPSDEIHTYLSWEGTLEMPDVCMYDPSNWKDSGIGADTIAESEILVHQGHKSNMITRLIFDDTCPMPGTQQITHERVIKFFTKAEGHKDPARGIFSANLRDRQAQSWMERAVDQVARQHPSYMIGQEVDDREAKVRLLTARPIDSNLLALYYSFDISGWSAKMPAEPQRVSHGLWGDLYGGHLFGRATTLNEGAHIYLNIDGYVGWFKNTHANLEGFNGKEMTMVLVALLSLSVKRWREGMVSEGHMTQLEADSVSALLFAYIDDGLSRIDLPKKNAIIAFDLYKRTVIETFSMCGFSVEVSKCFPSDRFSIFLNEVYLAGRHVVHGVRAAMGISSEPTERHTSLTERVTAVSTGVRGAVMAGLNPLSAVLLMAYHVMLHLVEWVEERDPVILAGWCVAPRAWGGLGLPSMLQLYVSGSGSAFEESVATMQAYARQNLSVKTAFLKLVKTPLLDRDPVGILTAPLSGRVRDGYMVDSRVAVAVRRALQDQRERRALSTYATRLLDYSDTGAFESYAKAVISYSPDEVMQEQMLRNLADAHPHSVFSNFARRLEKSSTVLAIVGAERFRRMADDNRADAKVSVLTYRANCM